MNEKQAKKVRKETRLYWQKYIARFAYLPLWERVKLAFAIVTLRANKSVQRIGGYGALSGKGSKPANR